MRYRQQHQLLKTKNIHARVLHQYPTTNRKTCAEHITRSPSRESNKGQRTMSTSGRSEGRPIFIAKTSKKCTSCGKWKIDDSFNLSSSNLACNKCEHKVWHRQNFDECGRSGARNVRLISVMHVLCTASAAVRYRLEVKSRQEIQNSREVTASRKRRVHRGLNHKHPVSTHRPKSVDDAVFIAKLNTKDQLPFYVPYPGQSKSFCALRRKVGSFSN